MFSKNRARALTYPWQSWQLKSWMYVLYCHSSIYSKWKFSLYVYYCYKLRKYTVRFADWNLLSSAENPCQNYCGALGVKLKQKTPRQHVVRQNHTLSTWQICKWLDTHFRYRNRIRRPVSFHKDWRFLPEPQCIVITIENVECIFSSCKCLQ